MNTEPRVLLTRAELRAGMLTGIGGEHDTVPSSAQLDRAADLIFSNYEALVCDRCCTVHEAERLLTAIEAHRAEGR